MNDEHEICDEEKAFKKWLSQYSNYDHWMSIIKDAFYAGFVAGWENKRKISAEESLQK